MAEADFSHMIFLNLVSDCQIVIGFIRTRLGTPITYFLHTNRQILILHWCATLSYSAMRKPCNTNDQHTDIQ